MLHVCPLAARAVCPWLCPWPLPVGTAFAIETKKEVMRTGRESRRIIMFGEQVRL